MSKRCVLMELEIRSMGAWFKLNYVQIIAILLIMLFSFPLMTYAHIMTPDDFKRAIVRDTQIIESSPNDSQAYCDRGRNYFSLKMYDLALADFNKAIEINLQQLSKDPAYKKSTEYIEITGESYWMIALIYKKGENIDKTFEYYAKAIEVYSQMSPDSRLRTAYGNLLSARAEIYIKQTNYKLAIADLTAAINIMKDANNVYIAKRAKVYCLMGEYKKAIEDYNSAIIYNENWAGTIIDRGDVYFKIGDYVKALADYNTALNFGSFTSALIGRANIYSHFGLTDSAIADYTNAIEGCEEAFKLNSSLFMPRYATVCAQAYYLRGKLYYEQGKYENALSDCNEAIKLKPDYVDALQLRRISIEHLKTGQVK